MKILFAHRALILGSVITQLVGRLRFLRTVPNLKIELAFEEDRGARDLLEQYAPVSIVDPWRFRENVASRQYDVVVAIDAPAYLDAIAEISKACCLVVEIHEVEAAELAYLQNRKFSCDTFVVPSRYSKRMLQERGLLSPFDPIEIAPSIVDANLFRPVKTVAHPRPIVGWVGKLDDHKGWKRFLSTASLLHESGADLDFWMVGGEATGEAMVEALLESIDALDLSPRLRWFPRIEHAAMHRFYSAIRASNGCVLSTSRVESSGVAIAEALLSGCPAVAPDAGALAEVAPGASYLPLYREIEQAAKLVVDLSRPSSLGVRKRLDADLPALRQRFSPESLGPPYLAMLARIFERRAIRQNW